MQVLLMAAGIRTYRVRGNISGSISLHSCSLQLRPFFLFISRCSQSAQLRRKPASTLLISSPLLALSFCQTTTTKTRTEASAAAARLSSACRLQPRQLACLPRHTSREYRPLLICNRCARSLFSYLPAPILELLFRRELLFSWLRIAQREGRVSCECAERSASLPSSSQPSCSSSPGKCSVLLCAT